MNESAAPPGTLVQPDACGLPDGPKTWPPLSCESSSGELAFPIQLLGVAPATVSVTGVFSGFAGSV